IPVPDPTGRAPAILRLDAIKPISKLEVVPIPFIGMRSGNFLGTASYFPRTGYDSQNAMLGTVEREEYDATVGYFVLPALVLSLGYKHQSQDKISGQFSNTLRNDALLLGASGNVALTDRLSFYGNAAYGF